MNTKFLHYNKSRGIIIHKLEHIITAKCLHIICRPSALHLFNLTLRGQYEMKLKIFQHLYKLI